MWSAAAGFGLLILLGTTKPVSAARSWQQRLQQSDPSVELRPELGYSKHRHVAQTLEEKAFTLRHIYHHGTRDNPDLHMYLDILPDAVVRITQDEGETYETAPLDLRAQVATMAIQRMTRRGRAEIDDLFHYARVHGRPAELPSSAWVIDEVAGPNITDKETVLALAKMAANAYHESSKDSGWMPVGGGWNHSQKLGWHSDGIRGHVYADQNNSTVVIALKGTSTWFTDGGRTTIKDQINDNLFGSCCCGQGGHLPWKPACDCMTSAYTCNNTCLGQNLVMKDRYYLASQELYHNVSERYPGAEIWLTGHSLGGVISALLGLTYGHPVVTYEAYPDALAASRLHLPVPPGYRIGSHQSRADTGIFHIGHTADPVFMGSCNSFFSLCTWGGFAFEGLCHTGRTCIFDTVADLNWRSSTYAHKIIRFIEEVLPNYDKMPECNVDYDCQDCFNWKFFADDGSKTTSTSSNRKTQTSTETCKTPGWWWGCRDKTFTSIPTTTSSTSLGVTSASRTSSTCKTPGWLGCRDTAAFAPVPAPKSTTTIAITSDRSSGDMIRREQTQVTPFRSVATIP